MGQRRSVKFLHERPKADLHARPNVASRLSPELPSCSVQLGGLGPAQRADKVGLATAADDFLDQTELIIMPMSREILKSQVVSGCNISVKPSII
jgi:hypothetical protein